MLSTSLHVTAGGEPANNRPDQMLVIDGKGSTLDLCGLVFLRDWIFDTWGTWTGDREVTCFVTAKMHSSIAY